MNERCNKADLGVRFEIDTILFRIRISGKINVGEKIYLLNVIGQQVEQGE